VRSLKWKAGCSLEVNEGNSKPNLICEVHHLDCGLTGRSEVRRTVARPRRAVPATGVWPNGAAGLAGCSPIMKDPAPPSANALTVDIEDYFHASVFRKIAPLGSWNQYQSRVELNTRKVLELLAELGLRGTFFVLGWVAERFPSLVREIHTAGHELGCHSYAHRLIYELTPAQFREDTRRARAAIEDASSASVHAYRAPTFSITRRSIWALEILLELGFSVDSSIFPTKNHLYGIPSAPRRPFRIRIQGADLLECPPPVFKIAGYGVPVTGGAYLRILPLRLQLFGLNKMVSRSEPVIMYFHPWELDPAQPRLASRFGPKFYHYAGLNQTEARLRRLLHIFSFGTLLKLAAPQAPIYEVALAGVGDVVFTPLAVS
jgi:polysaccharide deacetylase family protein (PEP-CTERM system associated)